MEKQDEGTVTGINGSDEHTDRVNGDTHTVTAMHKGKELINLTVMIVLFMGYSLTFLVPKFYGATDRYVGLFVSFCLIILFFNNISLPAVIRHRDKEFIFVALLCVVALINLVIVRSGFGAFFVAFDFIMIFYLSRYITFGERSLYILSGAYALLLLYWFIVAYKKLFADFAFYGYNTNTAATFTIYTLLCAFMLLEFIKEKLPFPILKKYPQIPGFFMTLLIIKGFQLSLWHRARGAFIMLVMFMVFRYLIPRKWWQKKAFYNAVWIFATLGSLMFVFFYIMLSKTGVNFRLPFFYKSVFSGRELIWKEFFDLFAEKPLTGIGTNAVIESFFEFNVHNAMYNFLVIHGIAVFSGILVLIYLRAGHLYQAVKLSSISRCAMVILLAVFIESFFDVDLIWADYSLNLLYLLTFAGSGKGINGEA